MSQLPIYLNLNKILTYSYLQNFNIIFSLFNFIQIEHLANVITHGIWVIPAIYAAIELIWRSHSTSQVFVAFIYGTALAMLFIVSTIFHSVFYCNRNR